MTDTIYMGWNRGVSSVSMDGSRNDRLISRSCGNSGNLPRASWVMGLDSRRPDSNTRGFGPRCIAVTGYVPPSLAVMTFDAIRATGPEVASEKTADAE